MKEHETAAIAKLKRLLDSAAALSPQLQHQACLRTELHLAHQVAANDLGYSEASKGPFQYHPSAKKRAKAA